MIYGFTYLMMVLAISAGWIILAVLKKPDFIEKPLNEVKNKGWENFPYVLLFLMFSNKKESLGNPLG